MDETINTNGSPKVYGDLWTIAENWSTQGTIGTADIKDNSRGHTRDNVILIHLKCHGNNYIN